MQGSEIAKGHLRDNAAQIAGNVSEKFQCKLKNVNRNVSETFQKHVGNVSVAAIKRFRNVSKTKFCLQNANLKCILKRFRNVSNIFIFFFFEN